MAKIYFITGVNGIGKSTLLGTLRPMLDTSYELHDFDERGVPDSADATWRLSETVHWLRLGRENLADGISTVICGFAKQKDIDPASEEVGVSVSVCLLDADAQTIAERIMRRYQSQESIEELERTTGKTPDKFAQDNVWVSGKFRDEALHGGSMIIDTTGLDPQGVAEAVMRWLASD